MASEFREIVGEWDPQVLDIETYELVRDTALALEKFPNAVGLENKAYTNSFWISHTTTSLDDEQVMRDIEVYWLPYRRKEKLRIETQDWWITDGKLVRIGARMMLFTTLDQDVRQTSMLTGRAKNARPIVVTDCIEMLQVLSEMPKV